MRIEKWELRNFYPEESFNLKPRCPKCGRNHMPWNIVYKAADDGPFSRGGEYMLFTCNRCGFQYATKPDDAEEAK